MFGYYYFFDLLVFILLPVLLVVIMCYIFVKKYNMKKKGKEKVFKLLLKNFEQDLINSKDDILFLLNSINREYDVNFSIVPILEDYIVIITNDETNVKNINDIHLKIKDIINKENQEMPFRNVPDEERRILKNISDNIKNNTYESINYDLQELSSVINTRNKVYEKANKINKWSLPIAVIGTIIAVVFGILSFRNIDYTKIENIINTSLENRIKE